MDCLTLGTDLPVCIRSSTLVINFLPNFPAGCEYAKSFFEKPLASKSAIARASPNANVLVVDDVGAKSRGQASLPDLITIEISVLFDIDDVLFPVIDATFFACLFKEGKILIISSVSPELDMRRTISFLLIKPISPCAASVGWINIDAVPVLERVAAIFWPIWPDFPTPITIKAPLEFMMHSHKLVNEVSNWFEILLIESDSIFSVLLADAM